MAQVNEYANIVKRIIREYGAVKPSVGDIRVETVCDDAQGHYELVYSGWSRSTRVHGPVLHHDGKVWVEHDGTSPGVVDDLLAAGIPAEHVVLAFQPPNVRPHTGFATG